MATTLGFEEIYKGIYIHKYSDKSNNVYYVATTAQKRFVCTGITINECKHNIDKRLSLYEKQRVR